LSPTGNAGIFKAGLPQGVRRCGSGSGRGQLELPLPRTDSARLTIYSSLRNTSAEPVRGILRATITRPGKPDVQIEQPVTLAAGEQREVSFTPDKFAQLTVRNPDLWWPYTLGQQTSTTCSWISASTTSRSTPAIFASASAPSSNTRDQDGQFPELGKGGNFYLKVNGKDFLVRGAAYTPDLLYANDPNRDAAILGYVKRPRAQHDSSRRQFPGDHIVEMADEMGIPLMYGLDVLQSVGEVEPVGRRGQPGRTGQPSFADRGSS